MPSTEVLRSIGDDFVIKVARVVTEAPLYGLYVLLMGYYLSVQSQRKLETKRSVFFVVLSIMMFIGCSCFLAIDIADLVIRLQVTFAESPDLSLEKKLAKADCLTKPLMWIGHMLFIFLLPLGGCVVVWRTWALYFEQRRWVIAPVVTLTGSFAAAFFELGCDVRAQWKVNSMKPSAASVGPDTCRKADIASYSLSFITNIICTALIFYKAWMRRRCMNDLLGKNRGRWPLDRILAFFCESGAIYLVLYVRKLVVIMLVDGRNVLMIQILQCIPIYNRRLPHDAIIAVNIVNAVVQQAMGIYPASIMVICHMQLSLWDNLGLPLVSDGETSQGVSSIEWRQNQGEASGHSRITHSAESEDPRIRTELFLRTLDARPKEFFATHVQRLYLDDMNLEDTEIENLLHTCSGIETLNCWFGFGYDRFKHPVTLFSSNLSSLRRLSIEFFALNMIWGTTVFESVTHLEVVNPPNTPFEWAPLSATTFPKLRYLAFGDLTYSEHIDLICSAAEVILKDCRSIELLILITPKEISLDNPRIITWRAYSHPKDHPTYWGDIKRGGVDFWDLVMYRTER
ncbi:hypothetical protein VNI00_013739 [Paramarasmius palmivorus]|uniref:Uncharacterized protein n=1 Tax=Paramarasmius palmivorus TaxID=297713 RepID=A0AAW0BXS8_9AGAR